MRVPHIYLETSVFNFAFSDQSPEKQRHTLELFKEIKQGKYRPFTSQYVVEELSAAPEPKRSSMTRLITEYGIETLPGNDESVRLAALYVSEGVIPQKYLADALHIALATVSDMNVIVSYNFKHIVKLKTIMMTGIINKRENYHELMILSPTEIIECVGGDGDDQ